ncbi:MAG: hypothetical protein AB1414_05620 [bacterium]
MKKKVLYIGGFELPDKNAAAHRVISNGKILRTLGYNVEFFGVDSNQQTDKSQFLFNDFLVHKGVNISKSKFRFYLSIKDVRDVINTGNYDVIIAYNFPSIPSIKLKLLCKKRNIKLVFDITEWYSIKGMNLIGGLIKGIDSFYRMRVISKKVDGLILISDYLSLYYAHHKNKVVIPPLVDLEDMKWINKSPSNNSGKYVFSYSGNPGVSKDNILSIVKWFTNCTRDDLVLYVIGMNEDEFMKKYKHEKIKNVKFLGRISHIDSLRIVMNSHFSILFRYGNRVSKAGFPTKYVESTTTSTPVITDRNISINHRFLHEATVLLNDINELTYRVDELIDDYQNLKQKAICNNDMFDFKKYAEVTKNFMDRLEL